MSNTEIIRSWIAQESGRDAAEITDDMVEAVMDYARIVARMEMAERGVRY